MKTARKFGRQSYTPTGREQIAVSMEKVSSMELFQLPDGRFLKVLYDVDLTVNVGQCHGIVGDSRFELQLLSEIIGNVKPHEKGRCSLLEIGMMRQKRRILPHVYYINDQRVLFEHMHVLGYLMFASEHAPGKPEVKQADWLKLLLRTDLYPFTLTYIRSLDPAEYVLVSALLAYASSAVLVVMDLSRVSIPDRLIAPFSALIKELTNAGKTVVLANTSRAFVQHTCTHASFLMDGTIKSSDSIEALCSAFDKHILRVDSPEPEKAHSALTDAFTELRITQDGDVLNLYGEGDAAKKCTISCAADVLEGAAVPVRQISVPAPSLEEAFLEVRRTS